MPVDAEGTIPVVLVDDHDLLAGNLVRVLEAGGDIRVLAVATTVAEAVAAVRTHSPAVVVMDHRLPDGTGIDATIQIKSEQPEVEVILLSGAIDDATQRAAEEAGIAACLQKATNVTSELVATVRRLA